MVRVVSVHMMKEQQMNLSTNHVTAPHVAERPNAAVVPAASVWNGRCRPTFPGGRHGVRKIGSGYRTPGPISRERGGVPVADAGRYAGRGTALRTYVTGVLIGGALFAGFFIATPSEDATVGKDVYSTASSSSAALSR